MYYWEAYAKYNDGFEIKFISEYKNDKLESEQQYELECILLEDSDYNEKHEGVAFYSVALLED